MLSNTDRKLDLIDTKLNRHTTKTDVSNGLLTVPCSSFSSTSSSSPVGEIYEQLKENLSKLRMLNINNQAAQSQLALVEVNVTTLMERAATSSSMTTISSQPPANMIIMPSTSLTSTGETTRTTSTSSSANSPVSSDCPNNGVGD